jgi:hypothetical protein
MRDTCLSYDKAFTSITGIRLKTKSALLKSNFVNKPIDKASGDIYERDNGVYKINTDQYLIKFFFLGIQVKEISPQHVHIMKKAYYHPLG